MLSIFLHFLQKIYVSSAKHGLFRVSQVDMFISLFKELLKINLRGWNIPLSTFVNHSTPGKLFQIQILLTIKIKRDTINDKIKLIIEII